MKKVLLLFGGNSYEHLISCRSAKCILKNIDKTKYIVDAVGITKENDWYLFDNDLNYLENGTWLEVSKNRPILNPIFLIHQYDVIFPITHGVNGEDGKLQGFLDLFQVPYVGCKTLASALGMDKSITKELMAYHNIPQVPYLKVTDKTTIEDIEKTLTYPMIVKPSNGGSSIGIEKANNQTELKEAIQRALSYDKTLVIEKFIEGIELECGILEHHGIQVSNIGQILPANEFYDYNAKYENDNSKVQIPAQIEENIKTQIQNYAKKIFAILHGSGYARVDFFCDKEKKIYFNEINTIPGFNTISMYPMLFEEEGISYSELLSILIENAK